ncbi:unnamed protein product [Brassica rapa subsp. trilocularis]
MGTAEVSGSPAEIMKLLMWILMTSSVGNICSRYIGFA